MTEIEEGGILELFFRCRGKICHRTAQEKRSSDIASLASPQWTTARNLGIKEWFLSHCAEVDGTC